MWVGDERSSLNRHGPGGRRAFKLGETQLRWETDNQAQEDTGEVGDEPLRSNQHGWVGDKWPGPKRPSGGWETSRCA